MSPLREKSLFNVGLCVLFLGGPLSAETQLLQCERQRYYEGEEISCVIGLNLLKDSTAREATVSWSVFDKTLKRETFTLPLVYKVLPAIHFTAPTGLRAVTPLHVQLNIFIPYHAEVANRGSGDFQLFPRDPKYWVGEKEFKRKTILVEKAAASVAPELGALGIPYLVETGQELQKLKHVDYRLRAVDLSDLDRKDPWFRWELVQLIRRGLSSGNEAKDLTVEESNH